MRAGEATAGETFMGHPDAMLDKRGRLIPRENYSKCDSERRHAFGGGDYSQGSADFDDRGSSDDQLSEEEFNVKRKSVRNMRGISKGMIRGVRNAKDRVATANAVSRRAGNQHANSRLFAKDRAEVPTMKHTDSKIDLLYARLKQCQGDGGIVDPAQALKTMNMVQIEEDPEAYVPNIEKQHRRREEIRKMEKWFEEEYAKKAYDADKALFDFDESVDNLS